MQPTHQYNPNNYRSFQAGRFDGTKSSFRHEMFFLPTEKASDMRGYSANAADDKTEAVDKMYVLMSSYYRILPRYFDKITTMDIYRRDDLSKAWSETNEALYLTITQESVEFHVDLPEYVQTFFTELVRRLGAGECIANLSVRVKRVASKEKYYQGLLKTSKSFATVEDLEKFCRGKIAGGEAQGLVEDFERKYKSAYFPEAKEESYEDFLQRQKFTTEDELVAFCKEEVEKGISRDVLGKFWRGYRDAHFPKVQSEPSTPTPISEQIAYLQQSVDKTIQFGESTLPTHTTESEFVAYYAQVMGETEAWVLAQQHKDPEQYQNLLRNFIAGKQKGGQAR